MKSQNELIYAYLSEGNSLTTLEALYIFGTMNLRSRISDIERKHNIHVPRMTVHKDGKHFNKYFLAKQLTLIKQKGTNNETWDIKQTRKLTNP